MVRYLIWQAGYRHFFAASYFRKDAIEDKQKNGVIIIVGAENGTEVIPTQNALTIMKFMNVRRPCVSTVYSLNTNNVPAKEDENALKAVREAAILLNNLYNNYLDEE